MTLPPINPKYLARIDALSVKEKALLHEICVEIIDLNSKFNNQPRSTDEVINIADDLIGNVAGSLTTYIIESLSNHEPADDNEVDAMAKILIPYHMENENLGRAGQELSRLLYLTMGRKAA